MAVRAERDSLANQCPAQRDGVGFFSYDQIERERHLGSLIVLIRDRDHSPVAERASSFDKIRKRAIEERDERRRHDARKL